MHKRINILAFILSSLFLVSYILFHWLAPETKYGDINGDGVACRLQKRQLQGVYDIFIT